MGTRGHGKMKTWGHEDMVTGAWRHLDMRAWGYRDMGMKLKINF